MDSGDETDDDDDDDWNENEEEQESTKCLFCEEISSSIERSIEHVDQEHHINLNTVKHKFNLDQYSYIKVCHTLQLQLKKNYN